MDIAEIRRRNVDRLIKEHWDGKRKNLANALNRPDSFLSRFFLSTDKRQPISANMARRIERATRQPSCCTPAPNLPEGWVDDINNAMPIKAAPVLTSEQAYRQIVSSATLLKRFKSALYVDVPNDLFTDSVFAMKVEDDSMQSATDARSIPKGYSVLVDMKGEVKNESPALIALKNKTLAELRVWIHRSETEKVQLRPLSSHYDTKHVKPEDVVGAAPVVFSFVRVD